MGRDNEGPFSGRLGEGYLSVSVKSHSVTSIPEPPVVMGNSVQHFRLSKPRTPSREAAIKDAGHIPEVLVAARQLVDSIIILKYTNAILFEVEPEAQFGVEHPVMEALDARADIETKTLLNLTGATRTGWLKLLLAVADATHRPSGQWSYESIEAALNQLEAAYAGEFGQASEDAYSLQESVEVDPTKLPERALTAYKVYGLAADHLGRPCKDRAAYHWLSETLPDNFTLPIYDTWTRYLREARKRLGEQKNRPRSGRTGRSVIRSELL